MRWFALRVEQAIRKATDCQQGEAKRSYRGFVTVVMVIIIIVHLLVLLEAFVLRVVVFHVII